MAKRSTSFICQACGAVHPRWQGRCEACGEWNSIVEETTGEGNAAPVAAGVEVKPTDGRLLLRFDLRTSPISAQS